ncbi:MAG: ATP-binding cassette domain-containing protein [Bacteroidales bacterium]|nr:ATP-binding cassette domain-containing protein [Bacteroidales bacterium]MDD3891326.1 ATP-binding cassette domain-containing protein [Bacteroidales bacterium]
MITIENLYLSYGKKKVIESLDLTISENTINGVVGLNGSGKTTLLNAIYGLKSVESGTIKWQGEKLTKKVISYLVTEPFFYSNITGNEYLSLFKNSSFDTNRWNELFLLPLDQIVDEYSTGMKKKLAILSVLKQDKPIIIFDEPFNGLDIETCRIIRSILLGLKGKSKTIIITSHIIETLTNLCDYIHYLEGGKILFSKEKEEFKLFEKELFEKLENKSIKLIAELLG